MNGTDCLQALAKGRGLRSVETEYLDKPSEECGVIGVYHSNADAASLIHLGLYALQHRGQESAGICVSDEEMLHLYKGMGLVQGVFEQYDLSGLPGHLGIGHVRYSTTGSSQVINAQPLMARCAKGQWALAHNGNLVNAERLRRQMMKDGSVFQTTTDSEVILNLTAAQSRLSLPDALAEAAQSLKGGFALVVMDRSQIVGLRDPNGIRPLCVGSLGDGGYIISSESCAIKNIGGQLIREIGPGEMVVISREGLTFRQVLNPEPPALCVFEYIYFARPDSVIGGKSAYLVRKAIGRQLAKEYPVEVDVVIGAPDSGITAAMGYAEASGTPYEIGLLKNRYIGRTFIQPSQAVRDLGIQIKLNPIVEVLDGKRVLVIDDSIVRGTTSAKIINLIRSAGAKEVHMAIASPPYVYPCFYGIDTSVGAELVARGSSEAAVCRLIGADSLHYISMQGLLSAVGQNDGLCLACFSGEYPVAAVDRVSKLVMEKG